VWSRVRQCIEMGQKIQTNFQDWLKVQQEWEDRIRSEISRFESEMGVTAAEEEKEKLVSRLLIRLRGIEEAKREERVVKEVREFVEAVKEEALAKRVVAPEERSRLKGLINGEIMLQQMRTRAKPPEDAKQQFIESLIEEMVKEEIPEKQRDEYIESRVREWFFENEAEWREEGLKPKEEVTEPPTPSPGEKTEVIVDRVAQQLTTELSTRLGTAGLSRKAVENEVTNKLDEINELAKKVAEGEITQDEATRRIQEMAKQATEEVKEKPVPERRIPPRVKMAGRRFQLARTFTIRPEDIRMVAENLEVMDKEEIEKAIRQALEARISRGNVDRARSVLSNDSFLAIAEKVGLKDEVKARIEELDRLKEMYEATVSPQQLNSMIRVLTNSIERGIYTYDPSRLATMANYIELADPQLVEKLKEAIREMEEPERPVMKKRYHSLIEETSFNRLQEQLAG